MEYKNLSQNLLGVVPFNSFSGMFFLQYKVYVLVSKQW